jgi:hypothetical protein
LTIKREPLADDTRAMNRVLGVCPTCSWPILEEVGQCGRCRPLVPADAMEDEPQSIDDPITRTVAGQMPSMAVFSETQQVSSAEKRSELAWREAQIAAAQRRRRDRAARWPAMVAGIAVIAVLVGVAVALAANGPAQPTEATPSNDLPWRSVVIASGSTVELPGAPVVSTTASDIGIGARVATTVPGASIAVTLYRADYGMRGGAAAAIDLLSARAADLGDDHATGRIKQSRDRWGEAYDLSVVTDQPVARLRAIVAGPNLFLIEIVGSQNTRSTQIFSRVVNTLAPRSPV